MGIIRSVGRGGHNRRADVKFLQIVLNMNLGRLSAAAQGLGATFAPAAPLGPVPAGGATVAPVGLAPWAYAPSAGVLTPIGEDGACGAATVARIELFQRALHDADAPSGRVDPGDQLLVGLRAGVPPALTTDVLRAMHPEARRADVERYLPHLLDAMPRYGIDTPLRRAHFLAQLGHESWDFGRAEEAASGAAYEGSATLGNTEPGDGVRFKGRGLIQLTGRWNYAAYSKYRGEDYVTGDGRLRIATDPATAVDSACWYWSVLRRVNAKADADDVAAVTRAVNGGDNGLADRRERTVRARYLLRAA
jgi:putative chitinase